MRRTLLIVGYFVVFYGGLPLVLARVGLRADAELALPEIPPPLSWLIGAPFLALGAWLLLRSVWELWARGGGLPISHLPPHQLVRSGSYRRLRHPIYVGYTMAFGGSSCIGRSLGCALLSSSLLTVAWYSYALVIEEPLLLRRFAGSYRSYQSSTRRLPLPVVAARAFVCRAWARMRPAAEWIAARPVLCRFGSSVWVGYGAFVAVGAGAACLVALATLSPGLPDRALVEYLFGLTAAMVIGGRLGWLAYQGRSLLARPAAVLRQVGFVSYGAYAAMFAFAPAWSAIRAPKIGSWWLMDRTMLACLACSAFGRLGCLSYGCCYGRLSAIGMRFSSRDSKVVREHGGEAALPRVPTQLLSVLLAVFSGAVMGAGLTRGARPGFATQVGMLVYGLGRFGIETLRDEPRFIRALLTRGQLAAAVVVALALGLLAFGSSAPASAPHFGPIFDLEAIRRHPILPLACTAIVFSICGYHRRKVGSW